LSERLGRRFDLGQLHFIAAGLALIRENGHDLGRGHEPMQNLKSLRA
jgi:hypothetical protein